MSKTPLALLCSDLHFCHKPPPVRAVEPDWYAAMSRAWDQMAEKSESLGRIPLVIAGDIFDKWNSPPELINFVIGRMREYPAKIYAVPGQHDLPEHNYGHRYRSAYGSLILAHAMESLSPFAWTHAGSVRLAMMGFPWGFDLKSIDELRPAEPGHTTLAVAHHYVWVKGHAYPGVSDESKLGALKKKLRGFDSMVFGDNHKGFYFAGPPGIMNCGTMMRRRRDEEDYRPQYGVLLAGGAIERCWFDISDDLMARTTDADQDALDEEAFSNAGLTEYVSEMQELIGGDAVDFLHILTQIMDLRGTSSEVRAMVREATE